MDPPSPMSVLFSLCTGLGALKAPLQSREEILREEDHGEFNDISSLVDINPLDVYFQAFWATGTTTEGGEGEGERRGGKERRAQSFQISVSVPIELPTSCQRSTRHTGDQSVLIRGHQGWTFTKKDTYKVSLL